MRVPLFRVSVFGMAAQAEVYGVEGSDLHSCRFDACHQDSAAAAKKLESLGKAMNADLPSGSGSWAARHLTSANRRAAAKEISEMAEIGAVKRRCPTRRRPARRRSIKRFLLASGW